MIKERHGIVDARRMPYGPTERQSVVVTDGDDLVIITLSTSQNAAGMTVEQARMIAQMLMNSADRVERGRMLAPTEIIRRMQQRRRLDAQMKPVGDDNV